MKAAIFDGNTIANVIAIPDDANPADFGAEAIPPHVGPGWERNGETFTPPGRDMASLRASTTIDRVDFAEALFDAGQLTEAELLEWASGGIPASVDADMSAAMSGKALAKARARVMSAQNVNRMNELVLLLQASRSLTDEQVDALFGIGT